MNDPSGLFASDMRSYGSGYGEPAPTRGHRIRFAAVLGFGMLAAIGLNYCAPPAHALDDPKAVLRLQVTEFCAVVGRPPDKLAEALNAAMAQDPKTWAPAVAWWNRIHERYVSAGCGDA